MFVTSYATPPLAMSSLDADTYTYLDAVYLGRPVRAVRFSDHMDIGGQSGESDFTV